MIRSRYLRRFLYLAFVVLVLEVLYYRNTGDTDESSESDLLPNSNHHQHTWFQKRKLLLEKTPHKKVILFCYMRGGSTFFSELFRQNPEVMYWYEPMDAFYMANYGMKPWHFPQDIFWYRHSRQNSSRRIIHQQEQVNLARFNHNILSCNFSALPTELLLHPAHNKTSTKSFQQCAVNQTKKLDMKHCNKTEDHVRLLCAKENVAMSITHKCPEYLKEVNDYVNSHNSDSKYGDFLAAGNSAPEEFLQYAKCVYNIKQLVTTECVPMLKRLCEKSKLVAYKGLRLSMNSVAEMLKKDPDLHIVYLLRDPRSTVLSRVLIKHTYRDTSNHPAAEAMFHCKKLVQDFLLYKKLNKLYPGAFFLVKFEDLIKNRYKVTKEIYDFLGVKVHDSVYKWLKENEETKIAGTKHSTYRANSTAIIDKWRTFTNIETQQFLSKICQDALELTGYPL